MFNSPFEEEAKDVLVPASCDVVFVGDLFAEDYIGGAELSTKALIDSAPDDIRVFKIKTSQVTMKTIESGYNKIWVYTNFSQLDLSLIPTIVRNTKYFVVEYDYKFCKYRSIELHESQTGSACDCIDTDHGKLISAFFHGAKHCFYMSLKQMKRYHDRFPFLAEEAGSGQTVLSSIFDDEFFLRVKTLKQLHEDTPKKGWLVLDSASWIKGTEDAIKWCEENNKEYSIIKNKPYHEVLEMMASAEGFVYLPRGGDTCPRMVLEAQLLGCELHINDNVQHQSEFPFTDGDIGDVEIYLHGRREAFWQQLMSDASWHPRISGYTTTYNCKSQGYPWQESIFSMLGFCAEIVVVDGGSTDGTWERLNEMALENSRIHIVQHKVDWKSKRAAVQDGAQKARARDLCKGNFCWQQDCDEIVHEEDYEKIVKLCRQFPKFINIVCLPVVEYWGGPSKVRMDINPWKWRISKNIKNITHGIPKQLQMFDSDGNLYAKPGTDGCDYIDRETSELIPHASFYTPEVHQARIAAVQGNEEAQKHYTEWFNQVISIMPGVHHYSWYNIERKIKLYRDYWQTHWESLYDIPQSDTAENNKFFDKPWSEVTEKDISELSEKLAKEMGGWIFHEKIDFSYKVPHMTITKTQPGIVRAST